MAEENMRPRMEQQVSASPTYAPQPPAPPMPISDVIKPRQYRDGTRRGPGFPPPPRPIPTPPVAGTFTDHFFPEVDRQIPAGKKLSDVANSLGKKQETLKDSFTDGIEYTISEDRTAGSGSKKNHLLFALKSKGHDHSTLPKPSGRGITRLFGEGRHLPSVVNVASNSEESSDTESPMDEEPEKMELLHPESTLTSIIDLNLGDTVQPEGLTTNDYEKIVRDLAKKVHDLAATNAELRKLVSETKRDTSQVGVQTFYEVIDDDDKTTFYIGEPAWRMADDKITLNGCFPVADPDAYLRRKGSIAFVIYKTYDVPQQTSIAKSAIQSNRPIPDPQPFQRSFKIVSDEMMKATKAWFQQYDGFSSIFPDVRFTRRIYAPFIWWYHYRKASRPTGFSDSKLKLVSALIRWIETEYGHLYDKIESQFQRGFVSHNSLQYLVKPGSTIIATTNEGPEAYEVISIPSVSLVQKALDLKPNNASILSHSENSENLSSREQRAKHTSAWDIDCRIVQFDGIFEYAYKNVHLVIESEGLDDETDITELSVIPLEYANPDTIARLDRRGRMFWQCRKRKVVSYRKHNDTLTDAVSRSRFEPSFSISS
jgi:hypothetical protein